VSQRHAQRPRRLEAKKSFNQRACADINSSLERLTTRGNALRS
jgi:hypothetical protein